MIAAVFAFHLMDVNILLTDYTTEDTHKSGGR